MTSTITCSEADNPEGKARVAVCLPSLLFPPRSWPVCPLRMLLAWGAHRLGVPSV